MSEELNNLPIHRGDPDFLLLKQGNTPEERLLAIDKILSDPLKELLSDPSASKYRKFPLQKKTGGVRWISEPVHLVKEAQRAYLDLMKIPVLTQRTSRGEHKVITGFIPGMSILDNARPHVGQKVVLSMDLKDFFGSVRPRDIDRFGFKSWLTATTRGSTLTVQDYLQRLLFTKKGLPQGSPASPMVANWAAHAGDRKIIERIRHDGLDIAYTRYADDLTFSGDDIPEDFVQWLISYVWHVFFTNARFADNKIKFMRRHKRQIVTGIVVNEKMSIPRERRMKLRAIKHRLETKGIDSIDQSFHEVMGELSYLHLTDRQKAREMIDILLAL